MFTMKYNETLKMVVIVDGITYNVNFDSFFNGGQCRYWFFIDNQALYYLMETMYKVRPHRISLPTQGNEKDLERLNNSLADKQRQAFTEVYHRMMHFVAEKLSWQFKNYDYDRIEKICKTFAETFFAHFQPSCERLPDLPLAQPYKYEPYTVTDLKDIGMTDEEIKEYFKNLKA